MKIIEVPNKEHLHELFEYREEAYVLGGKECFGGLTYRLRHDKMGRSNAKKVGRFAGNMQTNGYIAIGIDYTTFLLHRVIWVYHNGQLPADCIIDHADRNPLNNCPTNMRLADHSRNMTNQVKRRGTTSLFKGVSWDSRTNRWVAQIKHERRNIFLGRYSDEEEAARIRDAVATNLFGPFAVLNFPDQEGGHEAAL